MICLPIVLVLGRLKIVESLELILAPFSFKPNYTFPCTNTGGYFRWAKRNADGIKIISMISSVAYLLDLIVRAFLLRDMGSNRIILTLEQQVDVLEELVRDNHVKVNFTLATNGMVLQMIVIHYSRLDRSLTVTLHQTGCQCKHHASCWTSSSTS